MRSNIGFTDKLIRFVIAVGISLVVFSKLITGWPAIAVFFIAYVLLVTVIRGNCPLYRLLGLNTHRNLNDKARYYEVHQRNQTLLKNYHKNYQERYPDMENRVKA